MSDYMRKRYFEEPMLSRQRLLWALAQQPRRTFGSRISPANRKYDDNSSSNLLGAFSRCALG